MRPQAEADLFERAVAQMREASGAP